jgi:methylmalonyl-CoA/ethylmalonyl-CoA epimerase
MGRPRLHHVGIVVRDEEQLAAMLTLLGLEADRRQYVPQYEAECVFAGGDGATIEFIVPRGGKLAKFNRGIGGIHHIALEVDDLDATSHKLRDQGIELLEETPVAAGEVRINFLPPIHTRGVIVEFVERPCRDDGPGRQEEQP